MKPMILRTLQVGISLIVLTVVTVVILMIIGFIGSETALSISVNVAAVIGVVMGGALLLVLVFGIGGDKDS